MNSPTTCKRCILDTSIPSVTLDKNGICSHCALHDKLEREYEKDIDREKVFEKILIKIKKSGKKSNYDCIVGLSGGIDSTYCLYMAKQIGLRPLAFHYDNGWVADVAKRNIYNAVERLRVDLKVVAPPLDALKSYHRAAIKASIPETCLPCEIGIISSLYETAARENIRYNILGTSFRTEGINPLRWHYIDGAYFNSVIKKFGTMDDTARSFNKLTIMQLFKYIVIRGIKSIQFPLYLDWNTEHIKSKMSSELSWEYGGRAHFDCDYKPFGGYIEKQKFGRDPVKVLTAALVRSEETTREEALAKIQCDSSKPINQAEIDDIRQRLGMSAEELEASLREAPKTFLDYTTYYSLFKKFHLPIKVCCKLKMLPETLYEKFFKVV